MRNSSKVPRFLAGSDGVGEIMRGEKGESVVADSIFKMLTIKQNFP